MHLVGYILIKLGHICKPEYCMVGVVLTPCLCVLVFIAYIYMFTIRIPLDSSQTVLDENICEVFTVLLQSSAIIAHGPDVSLSVSRRSGYCI